MKLVERVLHIDADVHEVFELITDAAQLVRWLAPSAIVDARVGGVISWTHHNGDVVTGAFVELVPDRRVVFTFGWERGDVEVPPGSTTVEIVLRPDRGGTELRLVHRGLIGPMADAHAGGWANYLGRLAAVAERRDAGPDALADQRVPAARSLGLA